MALSANTVWEVRTAGNDTNGGGFVTGAAGTDYSQQNSKNTVGADISTTDAVAIGTTTLTSATANFGASIVGNIIYLAGGTGAIAGAWRQVTARASATSVTLDAAVAASTGMTLNIGGALASIGTLGVSIISSNKAYVKTGSYLITSASTNVSGGCISFATSTGISVEGYSGTRGDLINPPTFTASGITTATIWNGATSSAQLRNLITDGASLTSIRAYILNNGLGYKLTAKNCTNSGFTQTNGYATWILCSATGCSTQPAFLNGGTFICCESYANTSAGFSVAGSSTLSYCLSYNNTGASSHGFTGTNVLTTLLNCAAYNNGGNGFNLTSSGSCAINCIAETNTGAGFTFSGVSEACINCAGYNNAGGNQSIASATNLLNIGFITGLSSFFVSAGSGNFALNNTTGAGAAARAAGLPGIFPAGTTAGYLDIGAAQHQDAGGSNIFPIFD